jgi:hypothetical protein
LRCRTIADSVAPVRASLDALTGSVKAHFMAPEHLYADDATMQVSAKSETDTKQCWTYVTDEGLTAMFCYTLL